MGVWRRRGLGAVTLGCDGLVAHRRRVGCCAMGMGFTVRMVGTGEQGRTGQDKGWGGAGAGEDIAGKAGRQG